MSRLFEAISIAEAKRHTPKVTPRSVAPCDAIPTTVTAVSVTRTELTPEAEAKHDSPLVDRQMIPVSQLVSPSETSADVVPPEPSLIAKQLANIARERINTFETGSVAVNVSPDSRLVALADPNSLGAEKFRALVTRVDHLRKQREMKSFQVTSSVINEGKTLVAGNVAVTFAKYSGSKTLLIEGDLHRPGLADLLGLSELPGLSHWWSGHDSELTPFVNQLSSMPLWFLSAGKSFDRPSDILRSARFAKAFAQLASHFEWIVVDSTPMLPIVDANLWSRLVDGTLLVVREGLAPVKALRKGLQALDNPKLIGVVINEASGTDQVKYDGQYYGALKS